jgi:hypothetical protein
MSSQRERSLDLFSRFFPIAGLGGLLLRPARR